MPSDASAATTSSTAPVRYTAAGLCIASHPPSGEPTATPIISDEATSPSVAPRFSPASRLAATISSVTAGR